MDAVLLPTTVDKLVDPLVDLGNLLITDNDPTQGSSQDGALTETELLVRVRDNTQYLFNKIWELDRERIDEAIVAKLPPPYLKLPREKVVPEKKELTKWQRYAQEKGIRKQKKDSKVFDEQTQEWKPRYGYRRGRDDTKDWMIEIPDHADPMVDYYSQREEAKKERTHKNELQRLRNIGRRMKAKGNTPFEETPLGVSKDLPDRSKHELSSQMNRARRATASVGKFQPILKDEKVPKKQGVTRKFAPNEASVANERKRYLEILDQVSSKKPRINEERLAASQQHQENQSREAGSKGHQKKVRPRQKSAVHRQQFFQKNVKPGKKGAKGPRKSGKK